MPASLRERLDGIPLRNAKASLKEGESVLQKVKPHAGTVLETATNRAQAQVKVMAAQMGISESLVHRAFKDGPDSLSFHKLWDLPDDWWLELVTAVVKARNLGTVRTAIEFDTKRTA